MLRKMTAREIYRCATAYHKIKSRQIIEALYTDFTSWEGLLDFAPIIRAPDGSMMHLTKDPAMLIGVAQFQGTDVAIIAQQTPPSAQERSAYNYGLTQADGYGLALCMMDYAEKYGLTFPLLADADHDVAEKYGVWQQKSRYGRNYMGIVRTTYLIGPDGKVARRWDNVKVDGHADAVLATL